MGHFAGFVDLLAGAVKPTSGIVNALFALAGHVGVGVAVVAKVEGESPAFERHDSRHVRLNERARLRIGYHGPPVCEHHHIGHGIRSNCAVDLGSTGSRACTGTRALTEIVIAGAGRRRGHGRRAVRYNGGTGGGRLGG